MVRRLARGGLMTAVGVGVVVALVLVFPDHLAAVARQRPQVLVLGDSITAGYGLPASQAFPAVLQRFVDYYGLHVEIVAAGVSGATTRDGRDRVAGLLRPPVRVLVVALGGNDALQGRDPRAVHEDVLAIVDAGLQRGLWVVLVGMEAHPRSGPAYAAAFRDAFHRVARLRRVVFVPFLLEGVGLVPHLNQSDGIHPNAAGADRIARHLWPTLAPLISRLAHGEVRPR